MVVQGALHLEPTDTLNLSGFVAASKRGHSFDGAVVQPSRRLKLAEL
jgi:hypothetical protein